MTNLVRHILNTGAHMPSPGLGTYMAARDAVQTAVDYATHIGYRHIDTAVSYGNEEAIGEVLRDKFTSGKLKRKDIFVTTKIPGYSLGEDKIKPCMEASLERFKLQYVDMVLVHYPFATKKVDNDDAKYLVHQDLNATWRGMENIFNLGWSKAVGLSNFSCSQIENIWNTAKVKPSNLQLECHAYLQQDYVRKYCATKGIVVSAYGPLGAPGRPDDRKRKDVEEPDLLKDPLLQNLSAKYSKSPAQILLRYYLHLDVVPLPKSSKPSRIKENYQLFDFDIEPSDMEILESLERGHKYFAFTWAEQHPEFKQNEPW